MNKTYEEILDSMKNAYFAECGTVCESESQTMKRFEILASELFSLSCYGDYIYRQAFVQTAEGDSLDKLGELRGCVRKTASYASGELVFSVSEDRSEDIFIPENTVCSVAGKPYMQYATTADAVIRAGELQCSVMAVSLSAGEEYNVDENRITVMVNAPLEVETVTNPKKFSGGYNQESDTAFRGRIRRSYGLVQNSLNRSSCENLVMELEYVTDCRIVMANDEECMKIYVTTKTNTLDNQQKAEILQRIPVIEAAGADYEFYLSERYDFDLTVNAVVMMGFDGERIKLQIRDRLIQAVSALRMGDHLRMTVLKEALAGIEGLKECSFFSDDMQILDNENMILCLDSAVLTLRDLAVSYIYD